ncbi:protein of unknown function [Hyphomicrobium sp. MC1]|nr:protein of unknown function [Hyphomicrobium sp. MC1]
MDLRRARGLMPALDLTAMVQPLTCSTTNLSMQDLIATLDNLQHVPML